MYNKKILIIEDESDLVKLLTQILTNEKAIVFDINSGDKVSEAINLFKPEFILLDLSLPKIDGITICKQLKNNPNTSHIPIIIISGKTDESDIILGLNMGADDYLSKPFSPQMLIARIRSVLRRANITAETDKTTISINDLTIDPLRRSVKINNSAINLTYSEFQALYFLATRPGWVFTRHQIVDSVHGADYSATDRAVDVLIVSLRKKLGKYCDLIETVRGVGYRFKDETLSKTQEIHSSTT
jgi:two-component system, OmpR family, alkaline phosphatase synthesis response regulator PhoP